MSYETAEEAENFIRGRSCEVTFGLIRPWIGPESAVEKRIFRLYVGERDLNEHDVVEKRKHYGFDLNDMDLKAKDEKTGFRLNPASDVTFKISLNAGTGYTWTELKNTCGVTLRAQKGDDLEEDEFEELMMRVGGRFT